MTGREPTGDPSLSRDPTIDMWYRTHADQVLAYLQHRTDPQTAEDVLQEVFVTAVRRFPDVPDPVVGWLFGTARRLLANRRRGARRYEGLVQRVAQSAALEPVPWLATERFVLADLLAGLSDADREVLTLSSWYDLSAGDAATALGCSVPTYHVRLHRARRRLAQRLTPLSPPRESDRLELRYGR